MRLRALAGAAAVSLVCAAPAAAAFDPPDGTVITANLPASVPLGYSIDLDALCGPGVTASVDAYVQDPAGAVRKVNASGGYGAAFEATFGVEVKAFGTYRRWIELGCGAAAARRVEEGGFTVAGDTRRAARCVAAKKATRKARARLGKARAALKRKDTDARRKAVRQRKRDLRGAKKRVAKYCAPL